MKEADEDNRNGSKEAKHTDQQPVSVPRKSGVFMMRAEGQSLAEFKEAFKKSLREKGLLKPEGKTLLTLSEILKLLEIEDLNLTKPEEEFLLESTNKLVNRYGIDEIRARRKGLREEFVEVIRKELPEEVEPDQPTQGNYENQIFIRKAEGQSFEEFKTACKKLFREKGIIKD